MKGNMLLFSPSKKQDVKEIPEMLGIQMEMKENEEKKRFIWE